MNSLQGILVDFHTKHKKNKLCIAVERDGTICCKEQLAKRLCGKHYWRLKCFKSIDLPTKKERTCKFIDCNFKHYAKEYCRRHYRKFVLSKYPFKKLCSVINCKNKYFCKGCCTKHYRRLKIHGDVNIVLRVGSKKGCTSFSKKRHLECIVKDCNINYTNENLRKGLCRKHYQRWNKWGDYNIRSKKEYLMKLKTTQTSV